MNSDVSRLICAAFVYMASQSALAATTFYSDANSFAAASTGDVTYGFEGIAPAGSYKFVPNGLAIGPLTFSSNGNDFVIDKNGGFSNYGASWFLATTGASVNVMLTVDVAAPVTAIAFDMASYVGVFGVDVSVNGAHAGSFVTLNPSGVSKQPVTFVGLTSTTPITSISFTTTFNTFNDCVGSCEALNVSSFRVGQALSVPETDSGDMMLSGLTAMLVFLGLRGRAVAPRNARASVVDRSDGHLPASSRS